MTRRGSLIYYLTAWICGCFFMEPRDLDQLFVERGDRPVVAIARSVRRFVFLFLRICVRRACRFDWRVSASPNHDAAEMQDAYALGCCRGDSCSGADWRTRRVGRACRSGTANRAAAAFVSATWSDDGGAGGMVAGNSGRRRDGIFAVSRAARNGRAAT